MRRSFAHLHQAQHGAHGQESALELRQAPGDARHARLHVVGLEGVVGAACPRADVRRIHRLVDTHHPAPTHKHARKI